MKYKISYIAFIVVLLAGTLLTMCSNAQVVTTIAGQAGQAGYINGVGSAARFDSPHGIACDNSGNIYIADRYNHRIRKIDAAGNVTLVAGSGMIGASDGVGAAASFNEPWAVACDTAGNIYVADTKNYKIRKITSSGLVSTIAGQGTFGTTNGPAAVAKFGFSSGICVTPDGNTIYVADHNTHVIRKITAGVVSNHSGISYIAGSDDGSSAVATFNHPYGIELDNNGNIIVADEWNNMIRKVSPSGSVITLAGVGLNGSTDGQPSAALFNYPWEVAVDSLGNIFVADGFNHNIRKLTAGTWFVSTYAGTAGVQGATDGIGAAARFNGASGIAYNKSNKSLYVSDAFNEIIRKISAISSAQINIVTNAINNTVCFGDSIPLSASPAGLLNYVFTEGSTILGASSLGVINLPPMTSGTHSITCTATDANGATAVSPPLNITVTASFTPIVTPSSNISFCNGDSVKLSAPASAGYLWSTGETTKDIYIKSAGPFVVTVTNLSGCRGQSDPVSATVSNGPLAVISAGGPTTFCANDSVMLTATSGNTWLWSNGATTQSLYVSSQGNYTVSVFDAAGCWSTSAPVAITNYPGSQATITPSGTVVLIQGDSITLSADTANAYLWSTNATTQNITIYNSGTYNVSITSSDGCQSTSAPTQVIVVTKQQLMTVNGPTVFCQGNITVLNSFFGQGNQWYFNGMPLPGATSQQLTAADSGYYQVAAFQNGNWIFSDSVLITVNASPQMAVVNDTTICSGMTPLLWVLADPGCNIEWYNSDTGGTVLGTGNSFQCPGLNQNTDYYIEVTGSNGCKAIERSLLQVSVNPSPKPDFSYTFSEQSGQFTVTFLNLSQASDFYTWLFNDSSGQQTSTLTHPSYTFSYAGDYMVTLIATNNYGCIDSAFRMVTVGKSGDWFIPTTFTPNNDGLNDMFRVRGKNIRVDEMKIFDQWGALIYESVINSSSWDGMKNGEVVQNGTYIYKIKLNKNDIGETVTGTITVIK